MLRKCSKCQVPKPLTEFHRDKSQPEGRRYICKVCAIDAIKKRYREIPSVKERSIAGAKANRLMVRSEMLAAYGGKCECCGESISEFLTIDHINGNGAEHRRQTNANGTFLYQLLRKQGFPKDNYRLLCFNCNCGRGQYGVCPHQRLDKS